MKSIVISAQKSIEKETEIVTQLFKEGLTRFHLRKPHYSYKKMKDYLDKIPSEYHNRIIIHSNHKLAHKYNLKGIHLAVKDRDTSLRNWLRIKSIKRKNKWITVSTSFHSINELDKYNDLYDYVFLSPIFDSISKKDYQSGFKAFSLTSATQRSNYKVVALGGVDSHNIKDAFNMGFWGCGFLGTIWTNDSPIDKFIEIRDTCKAYKNLTL